MPNNQPEFEFQKQVVKVLHKARLANPSALNFCGMPDLGELTPQQCDRLKDRGYMNGWPDLSLIINRKFIGLELKAKGGRQSKVQKDFQTLSDFQGVPYHLVKAPNMNEILEILKQEGLDTNGL